MLHIFFYKSNQIYHTETKSDNYLRIEVGVANKVLYGMDAIFKTPNQRGGIGNCITIFSVRVLLEENWVSDGRIAARVRPPG
jgi:hypothetical protein